MKVTKPMGAFALISSLIVGCSGANNPMEPRPAGPGEKSLRYDNRMEGSYSGVEVSAAVDSWEGADEVLSEVTPLKVRIHNQSDRQVRVRYQDFVLEAASGKTYHALPLYSIDGSVDKPVVMTDYDYDPGWDYDWYDGSADFYVAPYTAPYYAPHVATYHGTWSYDPYYYDNYYRTWVEVSLPTQRMITRALPEGVIAPGGYVEGTLYFEKVPAEPEQPITLSVDLVSPKSGQQMGALKLGFTTDD